MRQRKISWAELTHNPSVLVVNSFDGRQLVMLCYTGRTQGPV